MSDAVTGEQSSRRELIQGALQEVFEAFHLTAEGAEGRTIEIPVPYLIAEKDSPEPFRAGKGSPEELTNRINGAIAQAITNGVGLRVHEGPDGFEMFCARLGIGIDCSNFGFRAMELVHERLGATPYESTIFRDSSEILNLYRTKPSWMPRDAAGATRELSADEMWTLESQQLVSLQWVAKVFGKDPVFIAAAKHLTSVVATVPIRFDEVEPGDLLAISKSPSGVVSHVGVVFDMRRSGSWGGEGITVDFMHVANGGSFDEAHLRQDFIDFRPDGLSVQRRSWPIEGKHHGFVPHYFCRPRGLELVAERSQAHAIA